jgi:hypothetical protein
MCSVFRKIPQKTAHGSKGDTKPLFSQQIAVFLLGNPARVTGLHFFGG